MRFGRFDSVAKSMVSSLYRAEADAKLQEISTISISIKVNLSTASMLNVLSELFGQSRYAFTGEIIEDFATDLFINLPPEKRAEVAEKADKLTTDALAKLGITQTECGSYTDGKELNGDFTWRRANEMKSNGYLEQSINSSEVA